MYSENSIVITLLVVLTGLPIWIGVSVSRVDHRLTTENVEDVLP